MDGLASMTQIDCTPGKSDGKAPEMTDAEKRRFHECMQDPKFVQLWKEYADEISDPKHLAEQEEYLKQVEKEANEKGDYSFTFAFPKPNFCVRLNKTGKELVFINICDSDKVEEPIEETGPDRMASSWKVPVSIGKMRAEDINEDGKRTSCIVFDAAYHPRATYFANQSDKFMVFLVEIAVENINQNPERRKEISADLSMDFKRMTEPRAIGNIPAQTMRVAAVKGKEGELVFDLPKKKAPERPAFDDAKPGDGGLADRLAAGMGDTLAKERVAKRKQEQKEAEERKQREEEEKRRKAAEEERQKERERREKEKKGAKAFAKNLQSAFGATAPPKEDPLPAGAQQPEYTLIHQGEVDLGDTWIHNDIQTPAKPPPKNLVLRVQLPGVRKAAELDLDVDEKSVSLRANAQNLALKVPLPFPVDADKSKAKFDKAKSQLTLTLPVIVERCAAYKAKQEHEARRHQERLAFLKEAREQQAVEDKEKQAERDAIKAKRDAELAAERQKQEERDAAQRELRDAMEQAATEERARREEEERRREEEEQRKKEEARKRRAAELAQRIGELEAELEIQMEKEEEQRASVLKLESRGFRVFVRDLEAARVAERMSELAKEREKEVPLTNRYIWQID